MFEKLNDKMTKAPFVWALIFLLVGLILGCIAGSLVTYYYGLKTIDTIKIGNYENNVTAIIYLENETLVFSSAAT